jgi:hypothetical protein
MPSAKTSTVPTRPLNPLAGLLSYLVPGLGQIWQGRVGKGLLFMVCIYTLFFYGVYHGRGSVQISHVTYRVSSNVYLPDTATEGDRPFSLPTLAVNLYNRPQFVGQFWVGIAAWPAIIQYMSFDRKASEDLDSEITQLAKELSNPSDPEQIAEKKTKLEELERDPRRRHPLLGEFQREPSATSINAVHTSRNKRLELAWVYTVIAGVLNIMVIYDAVAGPAFLLAASARKGAA